MKNLISEKALTEVQTSQRDTPRWDDPVYWKGIRIGQCQSCKRQQKDVTRNGLCWLCDVLVVAKADASNLNISATNTATT